MKKLIMTMVLMPMMALAASNLYMVIDLSDGPSATSYLVSYLDSIPTGGWTDEYKTSKLVLRRIESGSFKMCGEYDVTLTKSFYCGVFEVTQKQYELVTGMNPSEHKGDMRPVEMVSYDAIRGSLEGAKWPESSAVDSNSFMGKLRARTGLDFDLPTEAQWEYACRAGTTNLYNNGGSMEYDLRQLGRYVNNQSDGKGGYSEHTTVGSYLPNAWGLYDMHGNALERCLDWYGTLTNGVDPQGPSSGSERVRRGGAFCWYADWCTSVYRSTGWFGACIAPSDAHDGDGFRLSLTISTPQALLDLPTTWYVNGSTGSDSNSGTSESAPKATIQAAIDASAAGDTILVAPGTYAPIMTENKAITIQSTADAKTTIIDASGTSRRCVTGRMETGYDAHRDICTNTVVIGFTLQNGEANLPLHYSGEYNGGCADGGIYKNCVFLNGIGAGGGNVANAVLENCLVKGGKAYNGGNVICCIVRNCTVVDGTALHSGGAYYNCAVYNSICIGSSLMIGSWDWGPLVDSVNGQEENVYRDDPGFVDAANGDYRLAAGSPCIDAGDNSYVTTTTDLAGNARIANGMVDIGCYEYRTSSIPDEGRCRIKIYIDDKDFVKVKEGEIWIEHMAKELGIPGLYTSLPGRHNGNNYPVYVNGDEWMPDWSGAVDSPSTNCITKRVKLADFGVLMPLSQEYQYSLEVVTARTDINMVAAPSMGNDCISVAIDDDHYSAAAWYEFDIAWKKSNGTAVVPEPVTHTVTFDMNGAGGAVLEGRSVAEGEMVGELPDVTREGYSFDGWYTAASGGTKITASTTVTGDVTYYAHWIVNQYTMTFDANGGVGGTTKTQDYGTALAAPTVTREGYTFTGWSPSVPTTVPAADATYTAQWLINSYTVTFDAQGGAGGGTVARNHGAALGELPVPTRDGFSFDGWFTAASGGAAVSAVTVITGNVTFYAHWTEQSLYPTPVWFDEEGEEIDWTAYYDGDEEPFAAEAAATFDGYVLDGEEVCGLIQVKAGKANKKTGTSTVSASLTLLGEAKKLSYKGTLSKRGVAVLTCRGKGGLSLCLGTNAMWGEVDGLTVSGARNVFAKSGDPKAAALSKWKGAYTLALETVDASGAGARLAWGYSGLALSVEAKGKVKVSGTMIDGAKVSITSQLLVGESRCCIPVVVPLYSKKGGFAFNLWLHDDGTIEVGELSAWNAAASKPPFTAWFGEDVPVARAGTSLPATLSFLFGGEPDIAGAEVLYTFLPWEVEFSAGTKWKLPAAGSVKYDKDEDEYIDTKDSSNPSGLKLTYVSKTSAFKGSFNVYAVDASGRLKKYTANVSGVMVGRLGYGTATAKGVGSWPVFLE